MTRLTESQEAATPQEHHVDEPKPRRRTRSNGEGGVWEEKGRSRWVGSVTLGYDDEGRQLRRKVTGKTKRDVLARLADLQGATKQGIAPVSRTLTVGRFLDDWVRAVLPGTVAPATEQQYRDVVRLYITPHLGRKRLATLSPRDVAAMMRELEEEGRAANTRRLARSVLRRALRYAEQEGTVARNVAAIAHGVRLGGDEGRTLSPAEARQLLAHLDGHRLEAAYTVALSLGLRRGELLGLAWDDVDLDATPPRLTVRRALKRLPGHGLHVDEPKTRQSRRTVHLPVMTVTALRGHRRRQAEERLLVGPDWPERPLGCDLMFRTPSGTPLDPDNFRNTTYTVTEAAGLGRWSPHELRHSAASLLLAQGVPLKVVSETLGHSSIRVTADVYGHLLEPAKAEAADAMDRALCE